MMGEIDGADSVEDATDEKVKAWFETASTQAPKDLSEHIDAAVGSVS